MIDAHKALIVIDDGVARPEIVRFAAERVAQRALGDWPVRHQALGCVRDPALRNDVAREWRAIERVVDLNRTQRVAAAVAPAQQGAQVSVAKLNRRMRGGLQLARLPMLAGLVIEHEECPVLAVVHLRNEYRTAEYAAVLVLPQLVLRIARLARNRKVVV